MNIKIDTALLDSLTEQAKASPRLRMNLDLRTSDADTSQRMLNAIEPGSVVPIHRHQKTSETFVVLRGRVVVRRLLRKMGIMAIYPKRNLSKLGSAKYVHSYRLRGLEVTHSNHVWCIDITYIPMAKGFLYLTAIIDVYSRYIVGWDIHNTLDAENSLNVLRKAIAVHGKPEIVNSDQGSQFTCPGWVNYLKDQEITISMDGKGRALDNTWIERFWHTLKQEYVYICPAENGNMLRKGLNKFIDYYNNRRTHQSLDRKTPFDWYEYAA